MIISVFRTPVRQYKTLIIISTMKRSTKAFAEDASKAGSHSKKSKVEGLLERFKEQREKTASVLEFNFKKKRCRVLSKSSEVEDNKKGIVYWMSRDARVQDNWAFLYAQKLALKNELPIHVCFCLVPKFLDATIRHYKFLLNGLEEVAEECKTLNISFHLLTGMASEVLPKFIKEHSIGAVVTDFSPLRVPLKWVEDVKNNLPSDVPFVQVDAHNIVPVWITSDKQEYAARTIRNKINSKLDEWLTDFPPLIKHPHTSVIKSQPINWKKALETVEVDRSVDEVKWALSGYRAGVAMLETFINTRLNIYTTKRNDPNSDALSNLSPWFHFGHISVQRSVLAVKNTSKNSASVAAFCEEAIVRRELSDNFCFYNKNYDSLNGISAWAKTSLDIHKKDKRPYLYTLKELDESKTHDDLWNSAQIQMVTEGKMHGFLRMYWAKKILEWTETPEKALEIAIYLNDRYSLDGRDPNGYVGCMWSIGGIHDQGWAKRDVFGKIRYMNYAGCKRKFDLKAFVARYGGKEYKK